MIRPRDALGRLLPVPVADRFWAKTARSDSGCLVWTGPRTGSGYGSVKVDGKSRLAHRVAWEISMGTAPGDFWVLHHCDNPPCVNPEHLFLGTALDNRQDMIRKGRQPDLAGSPGESNPSAKLQEADVLEVRNLRLERGVKCKVLAEMFGVSLSLIEKIMAGRVWKTETSGYGLLGMRRARNGGARLILPNEDVTRSA